MLTPVSIAPWLFGWSRRSIVLPRLARAMSSVCAAFTRPSFVFVSAIGASGFTTTVSGSIFCACGIAGTLTAEKYSSRHSKPNS